MTEQQLKTLALCKRRLSVLSNDLDEGKQRYLASVIMDLEEVYNEGLYSNGRFMMVAE